MRTTVLYLLPPWFYQSYLITLLLLSSSSLQQHPWQHEGPPSEQNCSCVDLGQTVSCLPPAYSGLPCLLQLGEGWNLFWEDLHAARRTQHGKAPDNERQSTFKVSTSANLIPSTVILLVLVYFNHVFNHCVEVTLGWRRKWHKNC